MKIIISTSILRNIFSCFFSNQSECDRAFNFYFISDLNGIMFHSKTKGCLLLFLLQFFLEHNVPYITVNLWECLCAWIEEEGILKVTINWLLNKADRKISPSS